MKYVVGDKVKEFGFTDQAGKERKFPDDFKDGKVALFFLRHLGCSLCKLTVAELKDNHARFAAKSVRAVVVVQSTPKRVAEYAQKAGLPYLLVSDRERRLYDAFDVQRGGLKEFTAPAAFKQTIRATLKGHLHGMFEGDELQVPASFLLAPGGEVLYAHYGKDISDFGSVEELLAKA
jgi:thioredoxin-dependent peroxiredoxin